MLTRGHPSLSLFSCCQETQLTSRCRPCPAPFLLGRADGSDAETTEALRQAYHGTTAVSLELPCVGKDGSKVKCAITVLPIKTSGGSVEKYLSLLAAAGGNEELSRLRRADKVCLRMGTRRRLQQRPHAADVWVRG